ncbi:MAG: alanine dehydrogenase [Ignavibacteria bacterium]
MRIGIPKETTQEEKRVALAPAGIDTLVKSGHTVFIESCAGVGSNFTDDEFRKAGAHIVCNAEEVFNRAEMIIKITRLTEAEAAIMQKEQIIFSFLHLCTSRKKIIEQLIRKKNTAIAFELIERDDDLPVLRSMSEIAGQLSIQVAERYLESELPVSRGILMGGIIGVAPATVVIIGAGTVGTSAARTALGCGAQVIVIDKDLSRLKKIDDYFQKRVSTVIANPYTISRGVKLADVLIGAVLIKGEKVPRIVTEDMVKTMKRGAVIVDVSIDQGGCVETSHPTSLSDPVFVKHDVIHFCVPNMPAIVSRTASYGMTNASLDYILSIADHGLSNALLGDDGLAKGVCTYNGFCSNENIAETFNLEYRRLRIFSTN